MNVTIFVQPAGYLERPFGNQMMTFNCWPFCSQNVNTIFIWVMEKNACETHLIKSYLRFPFSAPWVSVERGSKASWIVFSPKRIPTAGFVLVTQRERGVFKDEGLEEKIDRSQSLDGMSLGNGGKVVEKCSFLGLLSFFCPHKRFTRKRTQKEQ